MKKIILVLSGMIVAAFVVVMVANAQDGTQDKKKATTEVSKGCGKCPMANSKAKKCDPAKCKEMGCNPAKCKEGKCNCANSKGSCSKGEGKKCCKSNEKCCSKK